MTPTQDRFEHIATPADATQLHAWDNHGTARWERSFVGKRHYDGFGAIVEVAGNQDSHGRSLRLISLDLRGRLDVGLTNSDARAIAAALLAAAAEIEELHGI